MFVGYVLRPEHVPSLLFVDSQFETDRGEEQEQEEGWRALMREGFN